MNQYQNFKKIIKNKGGGSTAMKNIEYEKNSFQFKN